MGKIGLVMVVHDDDCPRSRDVRVWVYLTLG